MPTAPLHAALAYLRGLAAPAGGPCADDAELLGRFADSRDESAFAELLRRHGPAVLGVCRRVLADDADAEDAFQATFVILARRAGEVARRKTVGGFLYGVAVRTALRARSAREKRRARERQVAAMPETAAAPEKLWDDLRPVLDEELAALPARYREPLRLCYLEGRTYDEAALALGCARGTVASRVARGRERLRARLAARGVAPSAAVLAAGLAAQTSTSAVPPHLPAAALRAAALARAGAAGLAALAPRVRELAEGAAREAVRARLRLIGVLLLVASAAGLAAVAVFRGRRDPGPETAAVAEAPAARAATWQMAARLGGSKGLGGSVRFSPDGRTLADVSTDGVLRLWNTATWEERGRYEIGKPVQGQSPYFIQFAPEGRLLALSGPFPVEPLPSNGWGTRVAVLEAATAREVKRLSGTLDRFVPDGSLVTVNSDNTLRFWDPHTFRKKFDIKEQPQSSGHFFSPDGGLVCTWRRDSHSASLWETAGGRLRGRLEGCPCAFAKDGKTLVTCLPGGGVKVWDCATGRETAAIRCARDTGIDALLSPDGKLVLTTTGPAARFRFGPDGRLDRSLPAVGSWPRGYPFEVRLWDARTGAERARLSGSSGRGESAKFSPDGRTVVYARLQAAGPQCDELVLWDVAAGRERAVLRTPEGVSSGSFSPDGKFLFTRDVAGSYLKLWDPATGERLPDIPDTYRVTELEFSPDGTMLADTCKQGDEIELLVFRLSDGPPQPPVRRGTPARREAPPPKPAPTEAARALAALRAEQLEAVSARGRRLQAARTDAERKSVKGDGEAAFAGRALQIARDNPADPAAAEALVFALGQAALYPDDIPGKVRDEALALLRSDLLPARNVTPLLPRLAAMGDDPARSPLVALAESSPYREVRGQAALLLAYHLAFQVDAIRCTRATQDLPGRPAFAAKVRQPGPPRDPDALERDAARWYALVRERYGDIVNPDQVPPGSLREQAERGLFALQHLGIGKVAPEIAGEDPEGKPFKLSDYRGNVVALIFWSNNGTGSWQPLYPYQRQMVARLAGKPFALLEVISGDDREWVRQAVREEGRPGRCWFDRGRPGPIYMRWQVKPWQNFYVLDASGVIRYKNLPDKDLNAAVDKLLRELTGDKVGQAGR